MFHAPAFSFRRMSAGASQLLFFSMPMLVGALAYQFIMAPWIQESAHSSVARFLWMILIPCALSAVVLFLAR
jgi:hypothetical protein